MTASAISSAPKKACESVLDRLRQARHIVVFTGSGISAESGIPTFRGSGGLWGNYRVEEVATPEAFHSNPKFVWNFYIERRTDARDATPNPAHLAIASWEKHLPSIRVVTQNIDGLHEKAGSTQIQELHGNIWKARCLQCENVTRDERTETGELPRCGLCGGLLRPNIVWFGEALDEHVLEESIRWMREAEIVFVVGTAGIVEPAASLVRDAKSRGAFLVEVNVEKTALTPIADISLFEKASVVLGEWLALTL